MLGVCGSIDVAVCLLLVSGSVTSGIGSVGVLAQFGRFLMCCKGRRRPFHKGRDDLSRFGIFLSMLYLWLLGIRKGTTLQTRLYKQIFGTVAVVGKGSVTGVVNLTAMLRVCEVVRGFPICLMSILMDSVRSKAYHAISSFWFFLELRLPGFKEYIDLRNFAINHQKDTVLFAPWLDRLQNISFIIEETKPEAFIKASHIMPQYPVSIFTDGSVQHEKSAYGIYVSTPTWNFFLGERLENDTSIFLAEWEALSHALYMAIEWKRDVAIYCDCRSLVQWLHAFTYRKAIFTHPSILALSKALQLVTHKICVCWIPGHWGIDGNEREDATEKSFLESDVAIETIIKRQNPVSLYKKRLEEKLEKRPRLRSHRPQGHFRSSDRPEKIYSITSRHRQQVALWLRSGHSPLNKHLCRVNNETPHSAHIVLASMKDVGISFLNVRHTQPIGPHI